MTPPTKPEERTRCEVWTRVMGYHRPTTSFNKGKQSEHRERRHFTEAATLRAASQGRLFYACHHPRK
jgi:hypothetical protein